MINFYPKGSIGYRVMNHHNDYGAELSLIFMKDLRLPSLSVVIPYYNSWNTINYVLESLKTACRKFRFEIILVDDGSDKYPAEKIIKTPLAKMVKILRLNKNQGRSAARNFGLKEAVGDVVAFMDSDVVIPSKNLIEKHLKLHGYFEINNKSCITFSLFNHLSLAEWQAITNKETLFNTTNDFRQECTYQSTWTGCAADKEYIGKKYNILSETDKLRTWPIGKSFGPWILPNMILGGFFTLNREKAHKVGGFSLAFKKYGFTETSLPTKIIAKFGDYVLPVPSPYLLHLHDGGSALSQEKRNYFFKKAHHLYFEVYLKQDLEETLKYEKI